MPIFVAKLVKNMKTVLVTGANGQLGNELRCLAGHFPDFSFGFIDIQELDLCDAPAVEAYFASHKPDYLINCAAYTAVEKAESDVELCYRVNRDAVANLAKAAVANGCRFLHVSTDYVFDGKGMRDPSGQLRPYREDDEVGPVSVYGASKLEGERELMRYCPDAVILRTAWLYSPYGNNFVKTMLRLGRSGNPLRVVADQLGTPTYAGDLASALMTVVCACEKGDYVPGIFHFTDEGCCTWYDFTREIHEQAGIHCEVTPVRTCEYPSAVSRPAFSVLDKSKFKTVYHFEIPMWQDSLRVCLLKLQAMETQQK